MTELNHDERDLLEWLGKEEYSQFGECYGPSLDALILKGLAQIHKPGEHQAGFIAKDWEGKKGAMYRAVSLTEAGRAELKKVPL